METHVGPSQRQRVFSVILITGSQSFSVPLLTLSPSNHNWSVNVCIFCFMSICTNLSEYFCVCMILLAFQPGCFLHVCADVSPSPSSLQQGVCVWSRWTLCCFSKGLGWPQINPLVFTILTATLVGGCCRITRMRWLGDSAVDKSLSNNTVVTENPSSMCAFVCAGQSLVLWFL